MAEGRPSGWAAFEIFPPIRDSEEKRDHNRLPAFEDVLSAEEKDDDVVFLRASPEIFRDYEEAELATFIVIETDDEGLTGDEGLEDVEYDEGTEYEGEYEIREDAEYGY